MTNSRPYLNEGISSGDRFNFGAFLGLLVLVVLLGVWVKSMSPLLGKFGKTLGLGKPVVTTVNHGQEPEFVGYSDIKPDVIPEYIDIDPAGQEQQLIQDPELGLDPDPVLDPVNGQSDPVKINYLKALLFTDRGSDVTEVKPHINFLNRPISRSVQKLEPNLNNLEVGGSGGQYNKAAPGSQVTETVYKYVYKDLQYNLDADLYLRSDILRRYYESQTPISTLKGRYSWYWPPYEGMNCDIVNGAYECEYMASGDRVRDNVAIAWACDPSIPLGSVIYIHELNIFGKCLDRGYFVKLENGRYWFDHLLDFGLTKWGADITVSIYRP